MGREINVEAGNTGQSTTDATEAIAKDYRAVLIDAFERRLQQIGGAAVTLDSVVEIATEAGYKGMMDQVASILRREGGFIVEPGPSGRLIVRRSTNP